MITHPFALFVRWWSEELVRALLWGAWAHVLSRAGDAQDRAFRRFTRLVDAAPLWPCYVEYSHPRDMLARAEGGLPCCQSLLILSDREEECS